MTIRLIRPINASGGLALGVVWDRPSHDRRLIVEYELQYRAAGDQWSDPITTISLHYVVQNLSHSTSYQIRVRGVSVVGSYKLFGEWSDDLAGIFIFH